jgi:hypothetical protein
MEESIEVVAAAKPSREAHKNAKLTNADVMAIRNSPLGLAALAKIHGVSKVTIWNAKTRVTFKHVP